jgi:hypothetical protein
LARHVFHIPVEELTDRLTVHELYEWIAYFDIVAEEAKKKS